MTPCVSFIIATRNRRDVLLRTLARLEAVAADVPGAETFIVDNASDDGTAAAVARCFPRVRLLALGENRGACGKNAAIGLASGEFIVFLDDDSYPLRGSIPRMAKHFQDDPRLGAASFDVRLPDGRRECSAYPDVFIGCGAGLRRSALEQVGGLPDDFFMQAEEYDLSLRLLDAGWEVRTFADLHVLHEKSPFQRSSDEKMRLDVRNNALLTLRRFPGRWACLFLREWMLRYWAIAAATRRRAAATRGLAQGLSAAALTVGAHPPVSQDAFERFARPAETRRRLADVAARHGVRRVVLVDWGKNMAAYRLACEAAGVEIVAVADPRLAGQRYRGVPVLDDAAARGLDYHAAIVSNLSPAHAAERVEFWRRTSARPVFDLFERERPIAALPAAA